PRQLPQSVGVQFGPAHPCDLVEARPRQKQQLENGAERLTNRVASLPEQWDFIIAQGAFTWPGRFGAVQPSTWIASHALLALQPCEQRAERRVKGARACFGHALVARLQPGHALPTRFIDGAPYVVPVNFAYRFLVPALRQSTRDRLQAVRLHSQQARGFGPAPLFGFGVLLDISARGGGEGVVAA